MNSIPFRSLLFLLLTACVLGGCMRLAHRPPAKTSYVLSAPRPAKAPSAVGSAILQVVPMRISPRFNGRSFVYRQSPSQYQTDFYHDFLVAPANLVQEEVVHWLSDSGLFASVSSSAGPLPPDFLLQGRITELYGDYSSKSPSARLAISFMLLDRHTTDHPVQLQQDYHSDVPLAGHETEALVEAWNAGLTDILNRLEEDLGNTMLTIDATSNRGG